MHRSITAAACWISWWTPRQSLRGWSAARGMLAPCEAGLRSSICGRLVLTLLPSTVTCHSDRVCWQHGKGLFSDSGAYWHLPQLQQLDVTITCSSNDAGLVDDVCLQLSDNMLLTDASLAVVALSNATTLRTLNITGCVHGIICCRNLNECVQLHKPHEQCAKALWNCPPVVGSLNLPLYPNRR